MEKERRSSHSLERLFSRLRDEAGWLVFGSSVASAASLLPGCAMEGATPEDLELEGQSEALLNSSNKDWAQLSGTRNRNMVQFVGQVKNAAGQPVETLLECGARGGCRSAEILLHVKVARQANVDLSCKRVGVVFRREGPSTQPVTVYNSEYKGYNNGWEDWHVKVRLDDLWSQGSILNVNAWYQPGNVCQGNTFYDDNAGDLYAVAALGSKPVLFTYPQDLQFSNTGVRGTLKFRVANLDFDKQLELHYTLNGGATWNVLRNGSPDAPNNLHYVQTLPVWGNDDHEEWEADLDLPPSPAGELRFAVGYKHALATGAQAQWFWDNAGGNDYRLQAVNYPAPQ